MSKQKLELMWVGKEKRAKLEPRILIEDPEKSYHADKRVSDNDIFDNMLIHGDNLLALKALEQDYAGRVKCIYIDPPYNTGNAFEHYDDGLEHSIWLSLMRERLELLKNLLSDDGSIWISIDDTECHYLKVILDEIFGRRNFIIQITVQRGAATGHKAINPTPVQVCDYMLVYARDKSKWEYKPVYKSREYDKAYSKIITNFEDDYSKWKFDNVKSHLKDQSMNSFIEKNAERVIRFAQPNYNAVSKETQQLIDKSKKDSSKVFLQRRIGHPDIYLYRGDRILFYKDKLKLVDGKYTTAELVTNLWDDMNYQGIANEGGVSFAKSKKPEVQIKRILEMATDAGDLILDSFLGSGTTAAVAHKMGRRWIGIELGEHCDTHCVPRLKKVIDGEDAGGITKSANWRGGGGFRYYNLAPSLVKFDEWGNPVINKDFNENMLVRALCKVEGFNFDPSPDVYWKQGKSTESDFIYVTTQHLTAQMLQKLSDDVGESCTLLICCGSFDGKREAYSNLTIKKIPKAILKKCEWSHDDYSLEIKNLPMSAPDPQPAPTPRKKSFKKLPPDSNQLDLF